jgi:DNA-binding transcriptional LysR family regulator
LKVVKTGGAVTVNSTETYSSACLAGLGIIQVPLTGARNALASGKLVSILPQFRAPPMPVSLVYPHRLNLSRRAKLFMDWMTDIAHDFIA